MQKHTAAIYLLLSFVCLSAQYSRANVFEKDDRVSFSPTEKPWTAVGKLTVNGGICTGTLIGPDRIITAAHCVIVDKEKGTVAKPADVIFQAAYQAGAAKWASWGTEITVGSHFPTKEFYRDWAIVRLAHKLGNIYGSLVPFTLNPKKVPQRVALVGYSYDYMKALNGSFQNDCLVHEVVELGPEKVDSLYYHDCDMRGGASGGPVIAWMNDQPYIVGINVAQSNDPETKEPYRDGVKYSAETANVAAPVYRAIMQILK